MNALSYIPGRARLPTLAIIAATLLLQTAAPARTAKAQDLSSALLNPAQAEFVTTPASVRPKANKYPATLTLFLWKKTCLSNASEAFSTTSTFQVSPAGAGISVTGNVSAAGCKLIVPLAIDSDAATDGYQLLSVSEKKSGAQTSTDLGRAVLQLIDAAAGKTPSDPEVDVIWGVLSKQLCGNNFGKRVQNQVVCIEVKIGNNSGHQLQLAGVGFRPKAGVLLQRTNTCPPPATDAGHKKGDRPSNSTGCIAEVSTTILNLPDETTPNIAYQTVRGAAQALEFASLRNILVNGPASLGILMAGFNPFFHSAFNNLRWTAGTAVVGTSLPSALGKFAPDLTIQQLNNLDDQSFRDGKLIPNNTQIRTMVFVERKLFEGFGGLAYNATCDRLYPGNDETKLRTSCKKQKDDPYALKLALGKMVIVGDYIDYVQRVVVDSGVTSQEASPTSAILGANVADNKLTVTATTTEKGNALVKLLKKDDKSDLGTKTVSGQSLTQFSIDLTDIKNSSEIGSVVVILPSGAIIGHDVTQTPTPPANTVPPTGTTPPAATTPPATVAPKTPPPPNP